MIMGRIKVSSEFLLSLSSKMSVCHSHLEIFQSHMYSASELIQRSTQNSSIGNLNTKLSAVMYRVHCLVEDWAINCNTLVKWSQNIEAFNKSLIKAQENHFSKIALDLYQKGKKIDISHYPATVNRTAKNGEAYGFKKSYGCTWYAFNRWHEVNGEDLVFARRSGNANRWADTIDKNAMKVTPTSAENSIVRNSIAVDTNGTLGHVVYIEAVQNGMVYYSESSYSHNSIAGRISAKPINEFKKIYEYTITHK